MFFLVEIMRMSKTRVDDILDLVVTLSTMLPVVLAEDHCFWAFFKIFFLVYRPRYSDFETFTAVRRFGG